MTKTRREFSPEFKREAVTLLDSGDRPSMQVATELGISRPRCFGLGAGWFMAAAAIEDGKAGRGAAAFDDALASGPGVADHAVEARARSHAHGA